MSKMRILTFLSTLIVIFTVSNALAEDISGAFKFGIDLEGDHEVSGYGLSGTEDVDAGISFSAELYGSIANIIDIGGGITYQTPRSQKNFEGDFNFIPIYVAIRTRFETDNIAPYFIGQVGHNFFYGDSNYKGSGIYEADLDGGLYWGFGGGIIVKKNFLIEALYSVNNGTTTILGYELDIEYSKITLNFGVNF